MKIIFLRTVLLTACCVISVINISAQSIERSVISSFGFSYSGASIQSDCTAGEVITQTSSNGGIILTQGFHQPSFASASCLGDFDFNGYVNVGDLLIFISSFGCTTSCGMTDLDESGSVNVTDLLIFISVFGSACF